MRKLWTALAVSAAACALAPAAADARPWRAQPRDLAIDYSQIIDNRSLSEAVIVWWLVPQLVGDVPEAVELLDNHVIIGMVHFNADALGRLSFSNIPVPAVVNARGESLKLIDEDDMAPAVKGVMVTIQESMRQSLGKTGEGIRFFVFEAGDMHACTRGRLSVPYAGETYTYDTPIPGCEAE